MAPNLPWIRYRDTSLYGIPSFHHRLAFRDLVIQACRRKAFDTIAVEMPESFPAGPIEKALDLLPAPSIIIRPGGQAETGSGSFARVAPFSPADSIVTALRAPRLFRKVRPGWNPDIFTIDADPCEGSARKPRTKTPFAMPDDAEISDLGLDRFFHRRTDRWQVTARDAVSRRRDETMAANLARLLSEGREILFVAGAAHFHPVFDLLDRGIPPRLAPKPEAADGFAVIALDPVDAWLAGWLDDIPAIVHLAEAAGCLRARSFSKWTGYERVLADALRRYEGKISPRRLVAMRAFETALRTVDARGFPELGKHTLAAASGCAGTRFAEHLARAALSYPCTVPPGTETARLSFGRAGRASVRGKGRGYLILLPKDGRPSPVELPETGTLSEKECEQAAGAMWQQADRSETALYVHLSARARELAYARPPQETVIRRSDGIVNGRIHWRRTIRARARGESTIYVRRRVRRQSPERQLKPDAFVPIAWIHDPGAPIVATEAGWLPHPSGSITTASYWLSERVRLGESAIVRWRVAYCVNLLRGRRPYTRRETDRLIARFPPARLSRTPPWRDHEIDAFRGPHLAIACAVKYAADHAIAVVPPSFEPSPAVRTFAEARSVKLVVLRTSQFDANALDRLAYDHSVPSPGPYALPFPWVRRFVPRVPL